MQNFGASITINLAFSRLRPGLGPGWAMLAGVLAGTPPELTAAVLLQVVGLWILVGPVLGTLWHFAVEQRLWPRLAGAQLPPPPRRGFWLPYAQPNAPAGRWALWLRSYGLWLRQSFWPASGDQLSTVLLGGLLALVLGWALHPSVFWLTLLALALLALAALRPAPLSAPGGGRLQSLVQFLLPFGTGLAMFPSPSPLPLVLGFCYWVVYLGALRMLGRHARAHWLLLGGQVAALLLLLTLNRPIGGAVVAAMLLGQLLAKTASLQPDAFVGRVRLFLLASLLAASLSLGVVLW
ncbi:MAG: hypothetical protein Kow0031_31980 [Anaerolineae bacterium]